MMHQADLALPATAVATDLPCPGVGAGHNSLGNNAGKLRLVIRKCDENN